ncbi:MAG TPA: helix-turn-helix domain-containing protein [Acidobacteriota bacterium]|nr:helix-turn-helix domain-containing protein [Acidobacteriota bacterium]
MRRAMEVQEVILRAIGGEITWMQAAEIIGVRPRTMRRWRARYEEGTAMTGCLTAAGNDRPRNGCRWRQWSKC